MELNFTFDGYSWVTKVRLPEWAGFPTETDSFVADGDYPLSDGTVELVFAPEGRDDSLLNAAELSLVEKALELDPQVAPAVIDAVYRQYPSMQPEFGYEAEEQARFMPDLRSSSDLKRLISPSALYVHQIEKDGRPYVGYAFGCTWDIEHGLGVLMHGTRCVEVGGTDTSFLLWIAKRDAAVPDGAG